MKSPLLAAFIFAGFFSVRALAGPPALPAANLPSPSIAEVVQKLGDFEVGSKSWKLVTTIPLGNAAFPTNHPQGVKIFGDQVFLTSIRAYGNPGGHLTEFLLDNHDHPTKASPLGDVVLGTDKQQIHAGGLDMHDGNLYVPVAENRAGGSSKVFAVSPWNIRVSRVVATIGDHVGFVAAVAHGFRFADWSSVKFYALGTGGLHETAPGTGWEYQDCKHIDDTVALCSAKQGILYPDGEIQLIRFRSGQSPLILHRIKVPRLYSDGSAGGRRPLTYNAMDFEPLKSTTGAVVGLRFYFVPHDDGETRLMIYDARP